jgi:DinB family protein
MPDSAEYLDRMRSFAQGRDPLQLQERTAKVLAELIAGVSEERLKARPAADKWSVGEILAHLAEDEISSAWRYRQMVEHDGIALAGFDQDMWARMGDYASRTAQESLELFRLLRTGNLRFLRNLAPKQWECSGIHAERGRITVKDLAAHMAGHDANHVEQIRRILG